MDHTELETIVKIKFGSYLYGTATSVLDLDIKGIYIPSARDILLQRITPIVSFSRSKEHGSKVVLKLCHKRKEVSGTK